MSRSWLGLSERGRGCRFCGGVVGRCCAVSGRQATAVNVVDRASCLVDGFGASRAAVAGVEDGAAEGLECFVETRAVVTDEASVHVLAP